MKLHASLLLLSSLPAALSAQEVKPPDIPALIGQLAAPMVRLRDEAQAALAELPESIEALKKAAESHPSEEARLRARGLLKDFALKTWTQAAEFRTAPADSLQSSALREVVVSPDCKLVAGANRLAVEICRTEDAGHLRKLSRSSTISGGGGVMGFLRAVTFSPDGKLVASTDLTGQVYLDDLDGVRVRTLPAEKTKRTITTSTVSSSNPFSSVLPAATREIEQIQEVWGISFSADGQTVYVFTLAGLSAHRLDGGERRLLALNQIFPVSGYSMAARAYNVSPDGKTAALGIEVMGSKDMTALVRLDTLECSGRWQLPAIPVCVAVNKEGTECLAGLREGGIYRCITGQTEIKPFRRIGGWITGIGFSPDSSTVMISASLAATPLRQIAYPSGELLWSAPAFEKGAEDVVFAGPGRIVISCDDCIRVWTHRDFFPRKPAAQ